MTVVKAWFPSLRTLVSFLVLLSLLLSSHPLPQHRESSTIAQARKTMDRIGLSLIDDRQAEVAAELKHSISSANDAKSIQGRDLLSLLSLSPLLPTKYPSSYPFLIQSAQTWPLNPHNACPYRKLSAKSQPS
jgi:hypothetical protein